MPSLGDLLVLGCALGWSLHIVTLGHLGTRHNPYLMSIGELAVASCLRVMLCFSFWLGRGRTLPRLFAVAVQRRAWVRRCLLLASARPAGAEADVCCRCPGDGGVLLGSDLSCVAKRATYEAAMVGRRLNRGRLAGPSSQRSAARARGNVMSAIPPSMPPAACMPTRLRTTHQPPSGSGRSAERGINEDREQRDRCRELRNPLNLVLLSLVFRSSPPVPYLRPSQPPRARCRRDGAADQPRCDASPTSARCEI